eukprot:JP436510.1.p1 GENE.JP436510.1~~JP436510.1.p1  ORF type:complete len:245 (-),score=98.71 JP436510.1:36-770(-)
MNRYIAIFAVLCVTFVLATDSFDVTNLDLDAAVSRNEERTMRLVDQQSSLLSEIKADLGESTQESLEDQIRESEEFNEKTELALEKFQRDALEEHETAQKESDEIKTTADTQVKTLALGEAAETPENYNDILNGILSELKSGIPQEFDTIESTIATIKGNIKANLASDKENMEKKVREWQQKIEYAKTEIAKITQEISDAETAFNARQNLRSRETNLIDQTSTVVDQIYDLHGASADFTAQAQQ